MCGQFFSIKSLFVRHMLFVYVEPHLGLKSLQSPVGNKEQIIVTASCDMRCYLPNITLTMYHSRVFLGEVRLYHSKTAAQSDVADQYALFAKIYAENSTGLLFV